MITKALNISNNIVKLGFLLGVFAFLFVGCKTAIRLTFLYKPHINDHRRFHKAVIPASSLAADPFHQGTPHLPDVSCWANPVLLEKLDVGTVEGFLEKTNTTNFIVVRNDSILYENYFNGSDASKQDVIFSITKIFITSLVAIAIEEGKISSVHQKVHEFIPAFREGGRQDMTLNHLLQMTSGLAYSDYENVLTAGFTYYSPNLERLVANARLAYPPSEHYAYKSIDTQVLGLCLEKAVGFTVAEYLQQKIWEPLGMEHDAHFTLDSKRHGNERMYGGMTANPRDLLKMGKLILDGGRWEGIQIIPEDWIASSLEREIGNEKWWGYSNGWWLDASFAENLLDNSHLLAAGFNGQLLCLFPKSNTIILRQGYNKGKVQWSPTLSQLNVVLGQKTGNCDKKDTTASTKISGKFVRLENAQKEQISIVSEDGKIFVQLPSGKQRLEAKLIEPRCLVIDKARLQLIFETQEDKIIGCYLDNYSCELPFYQKID